MSSIILFHHLGLGDHFMCHGIVREYCKKYDRVLIFSLPHNYPSVSFMYRDIPNLKIVISNNDVAKKFIADNADKTANDKYAEIKLVGFENLNWQGPEMLEKQFYRIANVPLEKKWESFFVKRDHNRELETFNKYAPKNKYVFVHEDTSRNYRIDRKLLDPNLSVFLPDPKLVSNVFDYCKIIEKAAEIHVIDSSFMFMIDCLKYKAPEQKLFVHRYARPNLAWTLPILRKNWTIIERPSAPGPVTFIQRKYYKAKDWLRRKDYTNRLTRKTKRVFAHTR